MTPRPSRWVETGIADREQGFSLVELLVAMLVTMIVTGAIYGLLAQGNNAFRREPELVDRQQNIRIAMDVIQRDIAAAGMGMRAGVQVFTNNLDGLGPAAFPSVINAGENSDILEMLTFDGSCPPIMAVADGSYATVCEDLPACFALPGLVYVARTIPADPTAGAHFAALDTGPPAPACAPGNVVGQPLNYPASVWNAGAFCSGADTCREMTRINLVRYQIDPDPSDRTPALWRSDLGTFDPATGASANLQPPNGRWQLIARGIEDLQVQYQDGPAFTANNWLGTPRVANAADVGTIVRRVRVTLSARALAINLQGESASAQGNAVRGRLVGITSPRGALINLQMASVPPGSPPPWQ
jgi:type II secretory pathway pseudopilin PulG